MAVWTQHNFMPSSVITNRICKYSHRKVRTTVNKAQLVSVWVKSDHVGASVWCWSRQSGARAGPGQENSLPADCSTEPRQNLPDGDILDWGEPTVRRLETEQRVRGKHLYSVCNIRVQICAIHMGEQWIFCLFLFYANKLKKKKKKKN